MRRAPLGFSRAPERLTTLHLVCVVTMAGSPLAGSRSAVHNMIAASGGKIIRSAASSAEEEHWEVTVAGQTRGDAATGWVLLGAPLDCSGTGRGEARAPRALRDQGLAQRTGARDAGDVDATVDDPNRDARTGVIGFEQIRRSSSEIHSTVAAVLAEGEKPLVAGGDCTVLVGALAAAKERLGRVGLVFVDGHLDYFGGETSPSGEAADMDLAFVTGHGPEGLVDLAGPPPIAQPGDIVVMGHRADPEEGDPRETDLVDERIQLVEAPAIKRGDPERLGRYVAERLEAQAGHFWVHFDVDVFDQEEMPAVTYPLPDGLGWEHAEALLRPLVGSRRLVGLSVADFVPDKDADGRYARRLVDLVASLFTPRPAKI
jgi:arginase